VDLAWLLVVHGADTAAQDNHMFHRVSLNSHVDLARILVEHGADAAAQYKEEGLALLHRASVGGTPRGAIRGRDSPGQAQVDSVASRIDQGSHGSHTFPRRARRRRDSQDYSANHIV